MARDETDSYSHEKYDSADRFHSYHAQVSIINELKPKTMLNIGCGSGFLKKYFSGTEVKVSEADIDEKLRPDFVMDIAEKQEVPEKFDLVSAFQVLEHIPFAKFEIALENIHKMTRKWAVISLPYRAVNFYFMVDAPFFKKSFRLEFERAFDNKPSTLTHEWEMGLRGTSKKSVVAKITRFFNIEREFVLDKHRYHYFFVLSKK